MRQGGVIVIVTGSVIILIVLVLGIFYNRLRCNTIQYNSWLANNSSIINNYYSTRTRYVISICSYQLSSVINNDNLYYWPIIGGWHGMQQQQTANRDLWNYYYMGPLVEQRRRGRKKTRKHNLNEQKTKEIKPIVSFWAYFGPLPEGLQYRADPWREQSKPWASRLCPKISLISKWPHRPRIRY